ncbi:methyl-accepting chemotaxis protein [Dasania sp. GY-MA-18]|uniref:Methyl-accepting chemotaxis protein n=1 Tax=Dasania phycosphaerae TaxID=2950436 RepID=A0A9J6RJI1_9GAMM|nr:MULTISPECIES: methyl-accepting chemotaxis protein [Dasania]MCR8922144.1 methyl-accepting chemotaxis protein [Dasania sp. GY-MA-18]MCZ0864572.1 methyl-accepting chemotaxis protein [Dasania phycosphaerae]MCZ0868300.1 methyl-accepting chemotaxis protein [Dasania phycosphaerae]
MNAKTKGAAAKLSTNRTILFFIVLLAAGLVGAIINAYIVLRDAGHDAQYLELTGELRILSQQIATSSRQATGGDPEAFTQLDNSRNSFNDTLRVLLNGKGDLPSPQAMLTDELSALGSTWAQVNTSAETIVKNRERILFLHDVARTLNESIPELQEEYNNVVEILTDNRAPADQVSIAQRQSWLAERIARNVDKMLQGGDAAKAAADQFNLDASLFGSVLDGMLKGNRVMGITRVTDAEAKASLEGISQLFEFVSGSVDEIFQASPDLLKAREAADKILVDAPRMMEQTSELAARIGRLEGERTVTTTTALVFVGITIFAVFMIGIQNFRNTRARLNETADTNERNQTAILRLLDELADLADGDLTTTATVSEDFTGAIADSINFTIDQLRILVSQINDTAVKVSVAAEETQGTALHLAEASEHQAQEIAGASAAVNEMAVTIDQVSSNAAESASVAERSVAIANTGAEVVQNTIHGMDNIREQIQETSKRIKRLGESSQEIGDIVSLINDIADQTNILALNAAIQASMAGDAGRGFAVVADEVQRLAERSSAATKQIEALVKTIQSDTNEAVISMEQTTAEVVRGARLAQDAGTALEEIETVSQELAELIQNISNAARQQASSAGHISNTMNVIQEITSQTSSGTTATAQSIGNLAGMANELKESVAGFKLPEEEDVLLEEAGADITEIDMELVEVE